VLSHRAGDNHSFVTDRKAEGDRPEATDRTAMDLGGFGQAPNGIFDAKPAILRESLNRGGVARLFDKAGGGSLAAQLSSEKRAADFDKLIGGAPGTSPLAGGLDPINFHPDLTRQGIDIVVAQPAADLGNLTRPTFSDSLRPMSSPAFAAQGGFLDSVAAQSGENLGASPIIAPQPERRKLPTTPLVLEIPKHTF